MTYNQFMKDFKYFQIYCVKKAIAKYGTQYKAAKALGISDSMLSRAVSGKGISDESLHKILGYDIKDKEIKSFADMRAEEIKNEIEELMKEAHSIGYDFF